MYLGWVDTVSGTHHCDEFHVLPHHVFQHANLWPQAVDGVYYVISSAKQFMAVVLVYKSGMTGDVGGWISITLAFITSVLALPMVE